MKIRKYIIFSMAALLLASCGTTKKVATANRKGNATETTKKANDDAERARIAFLDKVNDNASYQKNIVASITFSARKNGGKEISVPGQLRMRKNEVIRLSLQIPILGTEVGRIEFAKDHVLFVDRMHKEFVKAKYNQVSFLRDNGINFYTLQSLFWNMLYIPGQTRVGFTDLSKFTANLSGNNAIIPIKLKNGKLTFTWNAGRGDNLIKKTKVDYASTGHGTSSLTWDYSDFRTFGSKKFPYGNTMTIVTPASGKTNTLTASFRFNDISTANDWDAETSLSGKYKEVSVEDILGKLIRH